MSSLAILKNQAKIDFYFGFFELLFDGLCVQRAQAYDAR